MSASLEMPLAVNNLTFRYQRRAEPSICDISLTLEPGQILLLAGTSGCGKTTLMRCINGLAPGIYQGELTGEVHIFGMDVHTLSMPQLSQQVGTLLQDPERQIVSSHVFNEVAFGLENLAVPRQRIIYRVDETLEYLGISHLRDRETFQLSGGEKQKVAMAGILAMQPKILLLDEPLASLDPASANEALQLFRRLANDGISIMLVEHRVEDVLAIQPEQVVYMETGKIAYSGDVAGLLETVDPHKIKLPAEVAVKRLAGEEFVPPVSAIEPDAAQELVKFENVSFQYHSDDPMVLRDNSFSVRKGDIIAILGPNGAGKSTLVKQAIGLLKPTQGRVLLEGVPSTAITVAQAARTVGYVFQSPTQMLFAPTVEEELMFGPKNLGHTSAQIQEDVDWAIHTVHLEGEQRTPPLALSFGQQKRVSIAAILAMRSRILIMDEPTAGQDYWNYISFMDSIVQMPGFDAIIFITHDLDLALIYANRVLLLKEGSVAAFGPPEEVLSNDITLRSARVLSTSLLRLNRELLPKTGQFMRAEGLANFYSSGPV